MGVVNTILVAVQILAALGIIGLVLIQHGKGADMGAAFGSGTSGSLFGASGGTNALSKLTAASATVFFVATLGLAYLGGSRPDAATGTSVLDRASGTAPVVPASGAASAGAAAQIPTAAPVAPVAPTASAAPAAGSAAASGASAIPGNK